MIYKQYSKEYSLYVYSELMLQNDIGYYIITSGYNAVYELQIEFTYIIMNNYKTELFKNIQII